MWRGGRRDRQEKLKAMGENNTTYAHDLFHQYWRHFPTEERQRSHDLSQPPHGKASIQTCGERRTHLKTSASRHAKKRATRAPCLSSLFQHLAPTIGKPQSRAHSLPQHGAVTTRSKVKGVLMNRGTMAVFERGTLYKLDLIFGVHVGALTYQ